MLGAADLAVVIVAAVGLVGGGYLLALHRLQAERLRAVRAEERAQSFLGLLQGTNALPSTGSGPRASEPVQSRVAPTSSSGEETRSRPRPATDSRYLFVSFEEEIRRARERGAWLTLLTLSLGNPPAKGREEDPGSSDRLLRRVAHVVRGQMRGCDTCIRYAAEEFILILPGVSPDEARRVEGRLRIALQGVVHEPRPGVRVRARASLGSATFPEDGGTFDQILTLADSRRLQDSAAALPGLPAPPASTLRFRAPPPALSRN